VFPNFSEWTYQIPGPISNDVFFLDEDRLRSGLRPNEDYRYSLALFVFWQLICLFRLLVCFVFSWTLFSHT
jgi:hypothetical protein